MSLVYAILSSFFLRQIYWHIPVKMELWSSIVVSLCRLQFSLDNLYLVLASSGLECMDGCMDRCYYTQSLYKNVSIYQMAGHFRFL